MSTTLLFWTFPIPAFVVCLGVWVVLARLPRFRVAPERLRAKTLERAYFTALVLWGLLLSFLFIRDMIVEPYRTVGRVVGLRVAPSLDADHGDVYLVQRLVGSVLTSDAVPRDAYAAIALGDTVELGTTVWVARVREVTILEGFLAGYHHRPSLVEDILLGAAALVVGPVTTTFWGVMALGAVYLLRASGRGLWRRVRRTPP